MLAWIHCVPPFAIYWAWVLAMSILLVAGRLTTRADRDELA
jgi:hypothetical protein